MKYIRTYSTPYVRIAINTNSGDFCETTDNFLDLRRGSPYQTSKIRVNFHVKEAGPGTSNSPAIFLPQSLLKKRTVFSWLDSRIVSVTTDLRKNTVKALIHDLKACPKEYIIDTVLMQPLRFILSRHGFFFVHASMLSRGKNCVLISGPKDCGKSTLALTLALKGFELQSDDDCFISLRKKNICVFPFRTKMGLSERSVNSNPGLKKHILKNYLYGSKKRISLSAFARTENKAGYICKAVIFPKYGNVGKVSVSKVPKTRFMKNFTGDFLSTYPEKGPEKMLWTFYSLAGKVNAFELTYNDALLNKIPAAIERITGI